MPLLSGLDTSVIAGSLPGPSWSASHSLQALGRLLGIAGRGGDVLGLRRSGGRARRGRVTAGLLCAHRRPLPPGLAPSRVVRAGAHHRAPVPSVPRPPRSTRPVGPGMVYHLPRRDHRTARSPDQGTAGDSATSGSGRLSAGTVSVRSASAHGTTTGSGGVTRRWSVARATWPQSPATRPPRTGARPRGPSAVSTDRAHRHAWPPVRLRTRRQDHPAQPPGHLGPTGVEPGHQLLSGEAPLGERHRAFDQSDLGGDGPLDDLPAVDRHAGLDPGRLPGLVAAADHAVVDPRRTARRPGPGRAGRRRPGPATPPATTRPAGWPRPPCSGHRARARPTQIQSSGSMSTFIRSRNRSSRAVTTGPKPGVGVDEELRRRPRRVSRR